MPALAPAQESTQEVDSTVVSHQERLDRALIYSAGARYIVQLELDAAIKVEIQRRKDAGVFVGEVDLTQEEVDNEVMRQMEKVLAQDPTVDFWQLMRAQGFTKATFPMEVRRRMIGQRMFFPLDPERWPVEQLKEIMLPRWNQDLHADHQTLLEMKAKGEFQMLNEDHMNQFLMPGVWLWLHQKLDITKPASGLPEGVCLNVNGTEYRTADVLAQIAPMVSDVDRQWAKNFVANVELLEADLKASGHYLSQEEFEAYFQEEEGRYNDFFPHKRMVIEYYGFPSMETYPQYLRVRRSFHATLPAADTPEYKGMLDHILESYGPGYGGGRVQAEVLMLSAREKETGSYPLKGDPYAKLEARVKEVSEILVDGEDFQDVLVEYSDYPPSLAGAGSGTPQPNRGRFDNLQRHELRTFLGENDYTDFIYGYSLTDDIFYRSEDETIFGPTRNPLGIMFYRVLRHSDPRQAVDLEGDPRMKWQVNEDLLTHHLLTHLKELRK